MTKRVKIAGGVEILLALVVTAVGMMPVFVVSALGVELRHSDRFGLAWLGTALGAFFVTASITSISMRGLVHRTALHLTLAGGGAATTGALALMAAGPAELITVVFAMAIAGVAAGVTQLGASVMLTESVDRPRLAIAFGIRQAAIPVAVVLSGISLPLVAETYGWRPVFWVGVVGAATTSVLVTSVRHTRRRAGERRLTGQSAKGSLEGVGSLVTLSVGAGLAAMAGNALTAFLVSGGVATGLAQGTAGTVLALGGVLAGVARLGAGAWADRVESEGVRLAAVLLAAGAAGFAGLASGVQVSFVLGALLALGVGWVWPGLLQFAVASRYPTQVARATGIVQSGSYAGSALGPAVFGVLAAQSYAVAWGSFGGLAVAAALTIDVARRQLVGVRHQQAGAR